jgi:hypothetical protein
MHNLFCWSSAARLYLAVISAGGTIENAKLTTSEQGCVASVLRTRAVPINDMGDSIIDCKVSARGEGFWIDMGV